VGYAGAFGRETPSARRRRRRRRKVYEEKEDDGLGVH
jgi:hypothetical protein